MPADEQLDQPFLVGGAGLRQLQRVTAKFQPHGAAGSLATPQPALDRRHHQPQPVRGLTQSDQQRANFGRAKRPRTRRRLTNRQRGHILDIKLEKLSPQVTGQLRQPLGVCVLLEQLEAQLPAHRPHPRSDANREYAPTRVPAQWVSQSVYRRCPRGEQGRGTL